MLGAGDVMKQGIFKRTVYPNSSSKTLEEDLKETLIAITTTAEEAVAETLGTRDEVR